MRRPDRLQSERWRIAFLGEERARWEAGRRSDNSWKNQRPIDTTRASQMQGEYKEDFANAVALTEEVFSDIFDDEELDNLIVLHSNPAIKKMRGLNSEIVGKVLRKYSQVSGVRLPEDL
jgi:glutaredoxin 2